MAPPLLYEPERHEPLASARWDEGAARAWIEGFAEDAHGAYSRTGLWPAHPRDRDDEGPNTPMTMMYFGAAGVIWALDHLARAGAAASTLDFSPTLDELLTRNLAIVEPWGHGIEGLLMGQSGILLLRYRLAPDAATADAIAASVAANAHHPSLELLWGSPSTMHVALTMHEWTADPRWGVLFRSDAQALERALLPSADAPFRIWTQQLYGQTVNYLGAGHGFAGNASALIRGLALLPAESAASLKKAIVDTIHATALREGALANWPARLSAPNATTPPRMLVQWCHGSPGIVTSLARLADSRLDDLLDAAGELTWSAGPLNKGSGLCHGTAGNGFTFLKLFRRTGDQRWLDRARMFAMHAIAQSDRHADEYGQRRYSLWTGDPGVAWYVWNCIIADDALPNLDAIA